MEQQIEADDLLAALEAVVAMPEDPGVALPDVPDEVLPAQRILELLGGWVEQVDRWSALLTNVDKYVERLAALEPTAVPHMVVGL